MALNKSLNEEQKLVVEHYGTPSAVLAGAGSGKTTVLVAKYLSLLEKGILPKNILTVTFTTDAAHELTSRIEKELIATGASDDTIVQVRNSVWTGTIHSFCYRVIDQFGSHLGLPAIETIIESHELAFLFDTHYAKWFESLTDSSFQGLLKYFSTNELNAIAKTLFVEHFQFKKGIEHLRQRPKQDILSDKMLLRFHELLSPLFTELEKELHQSGRFTFQDLETLTLTLFETSAQVRNHFNHQFKAVLIDEFQDTSRLQWEILSQLLDPEWTKLFVVGDPKQSIYSFRHADVSLFRDVTSAIQEKNGKVFELAFNYRTHKPLLECINTISQDLFDGSHVPFTPMQGVKESATRGFQALNYTVSPEFTRSQVQEEELNTLTQVVKEKLESGILPHQITVLFRNADRMHLYQAKLEALGIPVTTKLSESALQYYEAQDIFTLLKGVENPYDNFKFASLLSTQWAKLDVETLIQWMPPKGVDLYTHFLETPPQQLVWLRELLLEGHTTVASVLESFIKKTHFFPKEETVFLSILKPLLETTTLSEAIRKMKSWEKDGLIMEGDNTRVENALRLTTVHAAKGLEFDHVILGDALRQIPHYQAPILLRPGETPGLKYREGEDFQTSKEYDSILNHTKTIALEEAKRILYVALTRAKESLTILIPQNAKSLPKGSWADLLQNLCS